MSSVELLKSMFQAAVDAALPSICVPRHLPPRPKGRIARRLARPGWVIMTLACVTIVVYASRYLTFDPEVYFAEQREP